MASPTPAKSQPLHNFELPELKWNKDGQSGGHKKRRRSIKSPSRGPNAASAAHLPHHPPMQESVSATPPRLQSQLRDPLVLPPPVHGECLMKHSPVGGESSKPSPNHEGLKNSPVGGEPERPSLLLDQTPRHFHRGDSSAEPEELRKGKSSLIEYRRNHSRSSAFASVKNGVNSSNSEEKKLENKSKATEDDAAGIKKSKILIKIPCKSHKEEEDEGKVKSGKNDEHGLSDEVVQEEGKTRSNFDDETKIWDLRPRKPKCNPQKAAVGGERGNVSALPEKKKSQSQSKNNASRSGGKEGKSGGSGGEKKEKGEKQEKVEERDEKKEKRDKEKGEKKEKDEKEKGQKKEKGEEEKGQKQEKIEKRGEKKEKGEKQEKNEKEKGERQEKGDKKERTEKEKGEKKEKGDKKERTDKEKGEKQEEDDKEKGEKKEKRKLSVSIALSKEEIEEDIYALTGSKPSRRPKKRAKNIQKQVDYVFPGLWLVSITPESYKG